MVSEGELWAASLGSALGGGILAVTGEEILRWWRRPQLRLHYADDASCVARTPFKSDSGSGEAIYLRLRVNNVGRSIARDCAPFMTRLERRDANGHIENILEQDSVALVWSLRSVDVMDIPRGINQFIDVCFAMQGAESLGLASPSYPLRMKSVWSKPGRFRADIVVTCAGTPPVSRTIGFKWNGAWDSLLHDS